VPRRKRLGSKASRTGRELVAQIELRSLNVRGARDLIEAISEQDSARASRAYARRQNPARLQLSPEEVPMRSRLGRFVVIVAVAVRRLPSAAASEGSRARAGGRWLSAWPGDGGRSLAPDVKALEKLIPKPIASPTSGNGHPITGRK